MSSSNLFCKCNTFMYIHLHSADTKVELHTLSNDKMKCHVFYS